MATNSDSPDPLDIFELSLPTLFSQPILAHSLPPTSSHFLYSHPTLNEHIKLKLPAPPAGLNALQAQYIWPSSLLLAHLLLSGEIDLGEEPVRVGELGAGSGLAGVAAAIQMGRRRNTTTTTSIVVATDFGDPSILATLEENYAANLPPSSAVRHTILPHAWGTSTTDLKGPFDVLLMADLLYSTAGHEPLLTSVLALLAEGGKAHLTAGLHGGRGAVDRFVGIAREAGLVVVDKGVWVWEAQEEEWTEVEGEGEGRVWWGEMSWRGEGGEEKRGMES